MGHFTQGGVGWCILHNCFLLQVRAKLELGLNHDRPFEPTLSAGQSKAVLSALTEGWVLSKLIHGVIYSHDSGFVSCRGQNIKALMQQIKSLSSMAPT